MEKEYISVIIPVHNVAPYLKRCVDSVLNQTYRELEIILVDNGSTDESLTICNAYGAQDNRVKVLHLDIADLSTARNEGARLATSPYISFIDSDDYIAPEMFETLMDNLKKYDTDISICSFMLAYEDGRHEESEICYQKELCLYSGVEAVRLVLLEKLFCSVWAKLYRKEIFDGILFPKGVLYEDYYTSVQWFERASKVVYIPTPLYYYWQRDNSICHVFNPVGEYHHFLGAYLRLRHVQCKGILSGDDYESFVNDLFLVCVHNFKMVVCASSDPGAYRTEIADMREKFKAFRREVPILMRSSQIRLIKIIYFGHLYCWWKRVRM